MSNILSLSSSQILAINRPEKLFSGPDTLQKEYRELARIWHPDHNPKVDQAVIAHISNLYDQGQKKAKEDAWEVIGVTTIETTDKKKYKIRYHVHRSFELGESYICDSVLVYLIAKEFKDLIDNSNHIIKGLHFPDNKFKKQFEKLIPQLVTSSETETHYFLIFNKSPDIFSVRDILNYFKGKIPPKHAAWMLSRIYNLACFLDYSGISHNDLNLDTYFVSPQHHTGMLLGGWWYASKLNEKMIALPAHTMNHIPKNILKEKIGSVLTDSTLIKVLGRVMLGDETGSKLLNDPSIPKPLFNWLQAPGSEKPREDYEDWMTKVLINSFGKREFVELSLKPEDVYTTH